MARQKSEGEARAERTTWFLLVLIFALLNLIPENTFPNWAVPMSGAFVLLGSGLYQYMKRWRVSPVTWIAGVLMAVLGVLNFTAFRDVDFLGWALIAFAAVIGFGVITGET
jgi:hypothetical protein